MRAADGAIEGVRIVDGEVQLTVIGDVAPVGMCGSGLVDAVAELVGAGILDHSGRFVLGSSERLGKIGEENVFYLSDDVFLSQRDVRELQFAKASIATGWAILCQELGVDPAEVSQVLLGGSFGSYLSAASAVKIGLVPAPAADAHRRRRKRRRRRREDRGALGHGARRGERGPRRGGLRRALRARRLQRLVHRPAQVPGMKKTVVACGALALHIDRIAKRRGWDLDIGRCRRSCTTVPSGFAPRSTRPARRTSIAYADCGTRGALDDLPRLPGADCYQLFGGFDAHEPATYYLTDFLVRSFDRVVWRGLGLDRHPELRDDYFRNYERVVWLAQDRTDELEEKAERIAVALDLPLTIRSTGETGLERALEALLQEA